MIASFDIGEKNFAYCIGAKDGTIIKWIRADVVTKRNQTVVDSCKRLSAILNAEKWTDCSNVIIEQQMIKNVRAQRLSQHVWTWFYVKYPEKNITFVPAYLKTQYYLGKNSLTPRQRKTWSVDKVRELLLSIHDVDSLMILAASKKQDDLADAYLQLYAWANKSET